LPYGPLRYVDFHALPFAGTQPLLATHLVAYSLDLPMRSASAPRSSHPVALVVGNPTRDLPTADTEAKTVGAAIQRWQGPWTLTSINGSNARYTIEATMASFAPMSRLPMQMSEKLSTA